MTILIGAVLLTACTTQTKLPQEGVTIQYETYGAFTVPEMSKQLLTIGEDHIIYITADSEGKITSQYSKDITKEEYVALIKLFNDNNFLGLENNYVPEELVTDVGTGRITVTDGNITKTVIVEPYFTESLPKNVKNIFDSVQEIKSTIYDMNDVELKSFTEAWIKNAPTYKYDGSELTYVNHAVMESYPVQYRITYTFKSDAGGYGDRSKLMGIQMITNHTIVVTISNGKVVSAITDDKWDELNQVYVGESTIEFRPLQCVKTPWRKWYEDGNIQFIKEPSEEELVTMFYSQNYNLEVTSFKMISSSGAVAAMCGNNESYYFTVEVQNKDIKKMVELGWIKP